MEKDALLTKIEELEKTVAMWKANHADMVTRNAILRDRPDLPVDRLGAYERAKQEGAIECIAVIKNLASLYEQTKICMEIKRRFSI